MSNQARHMGDQIIMAKVQGSHCLEKELVDKLKAMAKKDHRSFNSMLEIAARAGVKALENK